MQKNTESNHKPLHSTIRHQLKVAGLQKITNRDMVKLDEFRIRVFALGDKHKKLWAKFNFFNISRYNDPKIREKYGDEAASEMYSLYDDWRDLRREMEIFLEEKNLPLNYEEHVWMRPYVTGSSGRVNYDGTMTTTGFDSGPAKWCEITLEGMTHEMHSRRHIQRIEFYSIAGFVTGLIGIVISLTPLLM